MESWKKKDGPSETGRRMAFVARSDSLHTHERLAATRGAVVMARVVK